MEFSPLYNYPIWFAGVLFVAVLFIALESGYRVGIRGRKTWKDADTGGGAVVLTSMLALMGLVIAFTYASGVSRYDNRKNAVTIEANALGTAFLRADLVVEPGRTELRKVLLDYARTRYIVSGSTEIRTNADRQAILDRTMKAQAKIWPATKRIVEQENPGPIESALVAAINDLLDAHTIRLVAVFDKLPRVVMWMLVFISAASLGVAAYNAGIQGRMSRWRMTAFALVLSGIMLEILDFDRPNDRLVTVSQYSINSAIVQMEADLGP